MRNSASSEHKPIPSLKDNDTETWLKDLYDSGNGRCELRTAALYSSLSNLGLQDRIRIVSINNNHSIVEINHEGSWFKVDLGGENVRTIKAPKTERYQSIPVEESSNEFHVGIPSEVAKELRNLGGKKYHELKSKIPAAEDASIVRMAPVEQEFPPISIEEIITTEQKRLLEGKILQIRSFGTISSDEDIFSL